MSLAAKDFVVQWKEQLKTENCLSTFVVVGVVNAEIFMSILPFTNKQVNVSNLTFCFFKTFFQVPIPVNWYEIHSGYSLDFTWGIPFKAKIGDFKTT